MKKLMRVLIIIVIVFKFNISIAQEFFSLSDIHTQAIEGWTGSYTDKYGREIKVDIAIEVYGKNKAPVLQVGFHEYGENIAEKNHPNEALANAKDKGGQSITIFDLRQEGIDLDMQYGSEYGNDLTPRDIYTIFNEILCEKGIETDGFLYEQPEKFQLTYSKNKRTDDVMVPASYSIRLWSEKYGIPIFTHVSNTHINSGYPWYVPYLTLVMRSRDEYAFCDRSFVTKEVLVDDIPLCGIEQVIRSIESRIKSGHIQKVYSLRFGYSVYNDPNLPSNKRISALDAECYYLVPSWILCCEFMENPKENYNEFEGKRTITINAQTGKMVDPFDSSLKGVGDSRYKGYITWESIN
ncbi:MAG: hypothetical protein ACI3W5_01010 [Faecousia sp.]